MKSGAESNAANSASSTDGGISASVSVATAAAIATDAAIARDGDGSVWKNENSVEVDEDFTQGEIEPILNRRKWRDEAEVEVIVID